MSRAQASRRATRDVTADLDDHLKGSADSEREEENSEKITGEEAANPAADDRRRARDQRERG